MEHRFVCEEGSYVRFNCQNMVRVTPPYRKTMGPVIGVSYAQIANLGPYL